jgi:hypothetical protein
MEFNSKKIPPTPTTPTPTPTPHQNTITNTHHTKSDSTPTSSLKSHPYNGGKDVGTRREGPALKKTCGSHHKTILHTYEYNIKSGIAYMQSPKSGIAYMQSPIYIYIVLYIIYEF